MISAILPFSTDILILGAGPAGLAAALAASSHAQTITIVDENAMLGGQIWRGGPVKWQDKRAHALWQKLSHCQNVRVVFSARVLAQKSSHTFLLDVAGVAQLISWNKLIICTGARELLLPFPGWTLPGVTGAGGLQALVKGGMPVQGQRVVVAGSGPLLLAVAATVIKAGGEVVSIVESKSSRQLMAFFWSLVKAHRGKLLQSLKLFWSLKHVYYRHDARVLEAKGDHRLRSIVLRHQEKTTELNCDLLACGFGLLPNLEIGNLLGCQVQDNGIVVNEKQGSSRPDVWAAGEACGIGGVDKALVEGHIAGLSASAQLAGGRALQSRARAWQFAALLKATFEPDHGLRDLCKPSTLVCRCEDVTASQLVEYGDWRTAKLMTRAGMGACQGRICGAACQLLFNWDAPGMRQPVFPTKSSTLAALGAASKLEENR